MNRAEIYLKVSLEWHIYMDEKIYPLINSIRLIFFILPRMENLKKLNAHILEYELKFCLHKANKTLYVITLK